LIIEVGEVTTQTQNVHLRKFKKAWILTSSARKPRFEEREFKAKRRVG